MFGKLGFRGMTNFINSVLVHTGLGGMESLNPELNSGAGGAETDGGAKAPPLVVEGISEPEQWDAACPEGASVICIVALMPRSTNLVKEFQTAYASMASLGAAAKVATNATATATVSVHN
jgi:hypothetical protein